jgi:UDP-glucose 4-epimerase
LAVVEAIVGHSNPSMTRHYTHVGELAAGQAVAALPYLIGEGKPVAEGESNGNGAGASVAAALKALKQVTKKNWKQKVAVAVALLSAEVTGPAPEKPGAN